MSTMATRLTMLLFVTLISISMTAGHLPVDCCPPVSDKRFPCRRIKSYFLQDISTGCRNNATVVITKMSKKVCLPYPDQSSWVSKCISTLNPERHQH